MSNEYRYKIYYANPKEAEITYLYIDGSESEVGARVAELFRTTNALSVTINKMKKIDYNKKRN